MKRLLLEIARCEEARKVFSGKESPCKEIVESQSCEKEDFHLPEPWRGHLGTAQILFVSSNPGFSIEKTKKGDAPQNRWKDERIMDYFENSFSGGKKEWIKDGVYPLLSNGKYREEAVPYWKNVRKIACELLKKDESQIEPGKDYALTEVVHCKSNGEEGVNKTAREQCSRKYLKKIIEKSPAKLIISCGNHAHKAILDTFFNQLFDRFCYKDDLERERIKKFSEKRWFAFIKHPTRYGSNQFQQEEIEELQSLIDG